MAIGMRIGYARVSSSGHDVQIDRLADCERVFHEKMSGKSAKGIAVNQKKPPVTKSGANAFNKQCNPEHRACQRRAPIWLVAFLLSQIDLTKIDNWQNLP